jgi:protein-S-isoprenylcysteine O-methyltransferase Ste14
MAGAAEPSGAPGALVPAPAPQDRGGRERWLRLRPPRLARRLTFAALVLHAIVWGFNAPYGRSVAGGVALAAAGIGVMLWAWRHFRQVHTPVAPTTTPFVLVDAGPYRFSRNPMYLGIAVALLGLGLALGVPFMALAAAAFALIVHRIHIPHEEAALQRAFGGWYSDYAATVRRWL